MLMRGGSVRALPDSRALWRYTQNRQAAISRAARLFADRELGSQQCSDIIPPRGEEQLMRAAACAIRLVGVVQGSGATFEYRPKG
jgi:hypothetical protein